MDNITNRLDSSRIIVIVSVIYVIIITAISMYLYMKFNEKERFDRRFTKRLEDHKKENDTMYISTNGFYNNNDSQDSNNRVKDSETISGTSVYYVVSLVNCHVKTAFNCCSVNTYRNSWVSLKALNYCLEIGMRCLDFEIYSVNGKPVIGLNSREKNIDMKESFNKIPLEDAISVITNFNGGNLSRDVTQTPLLLHFRLKTKQKPALKQFAQIVKGISNRHTENYYDISKDAENEECFIHNNLTLLNNKTIVIANFSSILTSSNIGSDSSTDIEKSSEFYRDFISNTNIDTAVNLISPSKFCDYTTNRGVELAVNNEVEPNKLTLSAPFSDFEGSCVPFNPKEVARRGVQLIGICAQKNLEKNANRMVNDYFQLFKINNGAYSSYIAKSADSDNIHISYRPPGPGM